VETNGCDVRREFSRAGLPLKSHPEYLRYGVSRFNISYCGRGPAASVMKTCLCNARYVIFQCIKRRKARNRINNGELDLSSSALLVNERACIVSLRRHAADTNGSVRVTSVFSWEENDSAVTSQCHKSMITTRTRSKAKLTSYRTRFLRFPVDFRVSR